MFVSYGPNFQEGVVMGLEKGVSARRGMYSCELSSMLNTEENLGGVAITLRHSLFRNSTIGSTEKRCPTEPTALLYRTPTTRVVRGLQMLLAGAQQLEIRLRYLKYL